MKFEDHSTGVNYHCEQACHPDCIGMRASAPIIDIRHTVSVGATSGRDIPVVIFPNRYFASGSLLLQGKGACSYNLGTRFVVNKPAMPPML